MSFNVFLMLYFIFCLISLGIGLVDLMQCVDVLLFGSVLLWSDCIVVKYFMSIVWRLCRLLQSVCIFFFGMYIFVSFRLVCVFINVQSVLIFQLDCVWMWGFEQRIFVVLCVSRSFLLRGCLMKGKEELGYSIVIFNLVMSQVIMVLVLEWGKQWWIILQLRLVCFFVLVI